MELKKGSLIRWVCEYETYAAYAEHLVGVHPIHHYGIVIEMSIEDNPKTMVVYCYDCPDFKWRVLDINLEDYELLSEGI